MTGVADTAVARTGETRRDGANQDSIDSLDPLDWVERPGAEYASARPMGLRYPLVPWPRRVEPRDGAFAIDADTRIVLGPGIGGRIERAVDRWADRVRRGAGIALPVGSTAGRLILTGEPVGTQSERAARSTVASTAGRRKLTEGPARAESERAERNTIALRLNSALETGGPEGYRLSVGPDSITLAAAAEAGHFYGLQTLRQLLPADLDRDAAADVAEDVAADMAEDVAADIAADATRGGGATRPRRGVSLPAVEIQDAPRFPYRGMHLDVSRHFFPIEFVKRYIDLMALHKCNRFHWHLTDDQGWRLEIKRYPRLTEIGAVREETQMGRHEDPYRGDGAPHGGFYTQEQAREIVDYARDRFVTVIPEIDMPGHSMAALAAHPELACTDGSFEVGTRWGIYEDICSPDETTLDFLTNVLAEVVDIFPSESIHVGGDEAPKTRWAESEEAQALIRREGLADEAELQGWFMGRICEFLTERGRRGICWDDALEGGAPGNAAVMAWRDVALGTEAARRGHDVIMTPADRLYLDHYQGDPEHEPLAIGGRTALRDVHDYEPVPEALSPEDAGRIIGAQANLWTEYIRTPDDVEYMVYPRALAFAEAVWSPVASRDWRGFCARLGPNLERLNALGVNYRVPDALELEDDLVPA